MDPAAYFPPRAYFSIQHADPLPIKLLARHDDVGQVNVVRTFSKTKATHPPSAGDEDVVLGELLENLGEVRGRDVYVSRHFPHIDGISILFFHHPF